MSAHAPPTGDDRFNKELGCYSCEVNLYYDDITHSQEVHHAYFLRFWEHAREHMTDEDFLPSLIETYGGMFVTVNSQQKHNLNPETLSLVRIGSRLETRTRVKLDGKFKIRFLHESYIRGKVDGSAPILFASGHVDMVCVHHVKHSILPIPQMMIDTLHTIDEPNKPVPKRPLLRKKTNTAITGSNAPKPFVTHWKVEDFDTDFTQVVYQAKYMQYYEASRKHLLGQTGILDLLKQANLNLTVYKSDLTFKVAARPDEEIDIITKPPRVDGAFRVIFEQEMYLKQDTQRKTILNKGTIELICLDVETKKMVAFPESVREKF